MSERINGEGMFRYYYTDFRCAYDDILNEHIKISRIGRVNDPNEWSPIFINPTDGREMPVALSCDYIHSYYGDKYGFVSLSKSWNIAPMWGLYGDRYRGVVLELECLEPEKIIEVKYQQDRPVMETGSNQDNLEKLVAIKSTAWNFEQEVRCLHSLSAEQCEYKNGLCFGPLQIASPYREPLLKLRRVICGPMMNGEHKKELNQLCMGHGECWQVPIVDSLLSQKTYGLALSEDAVDFAVVQIRN